jgi:hypothetical protein
MKKLIIIPLLFAINLFAQEYSLNDVLQTDMLEFKSKKQAEKIAEKLWQIGVEVEIQEGYLDKEKRYYIELQDVSILDIEIQENGEWVRYFSESLKKKLIRVEFE